MDTYNQHGSRGLGSHPAMERSSATAKPFIGQVVRATCLGTTVLAFSVLAGWATGMRPLTNALPGYPAMNPLTAVLVVLAGASLWILAADRPRPLRLWSARACASAVAGIAGVRWLSLVFGRDLALDEVLFGTRIAAAEVPARMGTHTALALTSVGSALLALDFRTSRGWRIADPLIYLGLGVSLMALVGYVYSASPMHGLMSLPTAVALLLLSGSALLARPDRGLCALLFSAAPGGMMARRVLPIAFLLPVVLGWLRLEGQRSGLFGLAIGTSLLVLAISATLVGLVWMTGHRLDDSDRERREAEGALKQSVERHHWLLESNLIGVLTANRSGWITDANRAFFEMTGYRKADLPLHTATITPPEWSERTRQALDEIDHRGTAAPFEKEYVRRDGGRVPVLVGAASMPDHPDQVVAFVVDLSAKRSFEAEVERLRTFLHSIIENLPMMLFVKDARDLKFVRFNRAGEELLGFGREQLIGKSDHDFFPRAEADFFTSKDRAVLASKAELDIPEEPIQTARKGMRILHTKKVPILDPNGEPLYLLGISEDITERKRAEREMAALNEGVRRRGAQLEAANQELEAFSYSVSHDLRAPVRHIDGFSDLLMRHAKDKLDEKGQRYLEAIAASSKNMGRLIDDLLALSHMGRTRMQSAAVDLGALIAEVRADIDGRESQRRIEWRIGPLPTVQADRGLLRLALINLVANAAKYSGRKENPVIEVGAREDEDEDVIHVRDNGVGFDMRYQHKLFGVFQRLHRDDEFEGTGIGLATVRRIAIRHGGRAWGEGAVGEGATFYLSLPRTPQAEEREAA